MCSTGSKPVPQPGQNTSEGQTCSVLPTPPALAQGQLNKKAFVLSRHGAFPPAKVHLKLVWRQNKRPSQNVGQAR